VDVSNLFYFLFFFLFSCALTLLHITRQKRKQNMWTVHDLLNLKLNHWINRPGEADSNFFVFALSTFSLLLSLALASSLLATAPMDRKKPAGTALMTPRAAVYPASPQKCGFPQWQIFSTQHFLITSGAELDNAGHIDRLRKLAWEILDKGH
jgi:hypothetical protein